MTKEGERASLARMAQGRANESLMRRERGRLMLDQARLAALSARREHVQQSSLKGLLLGLLIWPSLHNKKD